LRIRARAIAELGIPPFKLDQDQHPFVMASNANGRRPSRPDSLPQDARAAFTIESGRRCLMNAEHADKCRHHADDPKRFRALTLLAGNCGRLRGGSSATRP
jgi:hypothetical protein